MAHVSTEETFSPQTKLFSRPAPGAPLGILTHQTTSATVFPAVGAGDTGDYTMICPLLKNYYHRLRGINCTLFVSGALAVNPAEGFFQFSVSPIDSTPGAPQNIAVFPIAASANIQIPLTAGDVCYRSFNIGSAMANAGFQNDISSPYQYVIPGQGTSDPRLRLTNLTASSPAYNIFVNLVWELFDQEQFDRGSATSFWSTAAGVPGSKLSA